MGEWKVRFFARCLVSGFAANHENAAQVRLHEKHNTRDSEYILLKNENGFTRCKV